VGQSELHWRPTLLVLLVVVFFGAVLPVVDAQLSAQRPRGGKYDLRLEGRRIPAGVTATVIAPPNWEAVPSSRESGRARLISPGASLDMRLVSAATTADCQDAAAQAARELTDDLGASATGSSQRVPLDNGISGTMTVFTSGLADGLVFVACDDGAALVATATAPTGARVTNLGEVGEVLATVRFE
jgi:hypothetical protein